MNPAESPHYRNLPEPLSRAVAPFVAMQNGPGAGPFPGVAMAGIAQAAAVLGRTRREAMIALLEHDVWPLRFARNRGVLSAADQAHLLSSGVAIVGCGGLGGHVAALLARLGVGALSLCDHDVFDETNLNRQLFAREDTLGRNKAEVAAGAVRAIASHVEIRINAFPADAGSLPAILQGMDAVVDCLDSLATRLRVESAAHALGLPFVHGAVAGDEGFAMLSRPGEPGLRNLYGDGPAAGGETAEKRVGVPTLTPAALAVLEASLCARVLLGRETAEPMLWHLDLSCFQLEGIEIAT